MQGHPTEMDERGLVNDGKTHRRHSTGQNQGMDKGGIPIIVSTDREHRPVTGGDTAILKVPLEFYIQVDDSEPGLAVAPFTRFLREFAEAEAEQVGEELHHARFVITTNPEVVRELGSLHDCADCREGVKAVVAFLASNPDREIVVGQLFWAGALN